MTFALSFLLLAYFVVHCCVGQLGQKPHIVYLLVDDLGWANVQFHNPRMITPNLDALLAESIHLQHFYTYKYCSPTRSALLSGRLPYHVNEQNGDQCQPGKGIPPNMTTISEKLVHEAGYVAHQVGKWHLGFSSVARTPFGRAFSTSLGYLNGAEDHWTQIRTQNDIDNVVCDGVDLWDTQKPGYGQNGTYGGYLYGNRAAEILKTFDANTTPPLFLYMAIQNNHAPYEAPQSYIDKFNSSWYELQRDVAAMSNFFDEMIGNLTALMKASGMWDNLLFVITADNGGPSGTDGSAANNCPLRGGKYSDFEGGVRVNALVTGGLVPKNRRGINLNGTMHIADWYSTFCALTGIDPTDRRAMAANLPPIDSINMWPFLIGEAAESPRSQFVLSSSVSGKGLGGIHRYPYKLLFGSQAPAFWTTYDYPNGTKGEPQSLNCGSIGSGGCLFNFVADPTEHQNIANDPANAALLEDLRQEFMRLDATVYNPDRGAADPNCCRQIAKNNGFWGPWLNYTWSPP